MVAWCGCRGFYTTRLEYDAEDTLQDGGVTVVCYHTQNLSSGSFMPSPRENAEESSQIEAW